MIALVLLKRLRHLVVFLAVWIIGGQLFFVVAPAAQRPRPLRCTDPDRLVRLGVEPCAHDRTVEVGTPK